MKFFLVASVCALTFYPFLSYAESRSIADYNGVCTSDSRISLDGKTISFNCKNVSIKTHDGRTTIFYNDQKESIGFIIKPFTAITLQGHDFPIASVEQLLINDTAYVVDKGQCLLATKFNACIRDACLTQPLSSTWDANGKKHHN